MENTGNHYALATVSALIGTGVYVLIISLLGKFRLLPTIIIAIVLWIGNFLKWKYRKRK